VSCPALTVLRGSAEPAVVTLAIARNAVGFWERTLDKAIEDLLDAATTPDLTEARRRVEVTHDRLAAARNRRDRLIAEAHGRRWLALARESADG